jgi:DNA-binding transcriptional regulator of glucitol operon
VRRFLSPRWLARHVALIVLVIAFLGLGWWQIGRAEGGNALSYGYAFEWPVFALFVIFVYYREVRAELDGSRAEAPEGAGAPHEPTAPERAGAALLRSTVPAPSQPAVDSGPADPELTEYNQYLAWLGANPDSRPADYRRGRVPGDTAPPPA